MPIKKLKAELAKGDDGIVKHFAAIEGAGTRLEPNNERYRARLGRLTEENKQQAADVSHYRALKLGFTQENPVLITQSHELWKRKSILLPRLQILRTERNIWITEIDKVRSEGQAAIVEAEVLRTDQDRQMQEVEPMRRDQYK